MTEKHFGLQGPQDNSKTSEQTCQGLRRNWKTPELFEADYGVTGGKTAVGADAMGPGSG